MALAEKRSSGRQVLLAADKLIVVGVAVVVCRHLSCLSWNLGIVKIVEAA